MNTAYLGKYVTKRTGKDGFRMGYAKLVMPLAPSVRKQWDAIQFKKCELHMDGKDNCRHN